jgi:hypothetical protein
VGRWPYIAVLVVAFAAGAVGVWAIAGGDGDETPPPPGPAFETTESPPPGDGAAAAKPDEFDQPAGSQARRAVTRAVRRYIEAITDRDGAALCRLVSGVADLDLPEERATCAGSVSASIGYRDPRGYPVFERARIAGRPKVELSGPEARATATVVTDFADRDEPSIEDDVIYLERGADGWAILKPSSTLYRAIGTPDVPPRVLTPP